MKNLFFFPLLRYNNINLKTKTLRSEVRRMASTREYLDFVLEQLSALDGIRTRAMMGEYVLYCSGKVIGGVYDDRLLLKPTPGALRLLEDEGLSAQYDIPYPGAKELLVADVDDREFCSRLAAVIADELTAPKKRG